MGLIVKAIGNSGSVTSFPLYRLIEPDQTSPVQFSHVFLILIDL